VLGEWPERHTGLDFVGFLGRADAIIRAGNCTTPDVRVWLEDHTHVHFHFTPKGIVDQFDSSGWGS